MKLSKRITMSCAVSSSLLAGLMAVPQEANAARREYTVIVLDASGSMLEPALNSTNPGGGTNLRAKWDEALDRAYSRVDNQMNHVDLDAAGASLPVSEHCYAIWTFSDAVATQRYPLASGSTSPIVEPFDELNVPFTLCTDQDENVYYEVMDQLEQIRTTVRPPTEIPATPLAHTACKALKAVRAAAGRVPSTHEGWRRIHLHSDGKENNTQSTDPCYGAGSETTYNDTKVNGSDTTHYAWAGGLTANSWEWKLFNQAFSNDPVTVPSPLRLVGQSWTDYISNVLYPGIPKAQRVVAVDIQSYYNYVASASMEYASDVPAKLQTFYNGLSKASQGIATKVQYKYNALPGINHPYNWADGDNSGCVDVADYSVTTRADIYNHYSRVGGSVIEIVNKYDVTRDGKVDWQDEDAIIANWGRGQNCNPPRP